jgi:Flp pilus assembly protein TadD
LLLVAGCASGPQTRPASGGALEPAARPATAVPQPGGGAAGTQSAPAPSVRPRNAAAASLQATAEQQRASGDTEKAAATLERALRIDPRDPMLWLSLAEIRLQQGDRSQAVELARRAETLAAPGSDAAARARALAGRAGGG